MAYKTVKWTGLRKGSKVQYRGEIRTVEIIDKPNQFYPKITFDKGSVVAFPLTYFIRISY